MIESVEGRPGETVAEYRASVIVPMDVKSYEELYVNDMDERPRFDRLHIPEGIYGDLYGVPGQDGLFQLINWECGALIDEMEQEWIKGDKLDAMNRVIADVKGVSGARTAMWRSELEAMIVRAKRRGVGVLFAL